MPADPSPQRQEHPSQLNLSSCSVAQLVAVSGITQHKANAIVQERDLNGPFTDWRDVEGRVRGVAATTVDKLRAAGVVVNDATTDAKLAEPATVTAAHNDPLKVDSTTQPIKTDNKRPVGRFKKPAAGHQTGINTPPDALIAAAVQTTTAKPAPKPRNPVINLFRQLFGQHKPPNKTPSPSAPSSKHSRKHSTLAHHSSPILAPEHNSVVHPPDRTSNSLGEPAPTSYSANTADSNAKWWEVRVHPRACTAAPSRNLLPASDWFSLERRDQACSHATAARLKQGCISAAKSAPRLS